MRQLQITEWSSLFRPHRHQMREAWIFLGTSESQTKMHNSLAPQLTLLQCNLWTYSQNLWIKTSWIRPRLQHFHQLQRWFRCTGSACIFALHSQQYAVLCIPTTMTILRQILESSCHEQSDLGMDKWVVWIALKHKCKSPCPTLVWSAFGRKHAASLLKKLKCRPVQMRICKQWQLLGCDISQHIWLLLYKTSVKTLEYQCQ